MTDNPTPTPPPYVRGPWQPRAADPHSWAERCKDEVEQARQRRLERDAERRKQALPEESA